MTPNNSNNYTSASSSSSSQYRHQHQHQHQHQSTPQSESSLPSLDVVATAADFDALNDLEQLLLMRDNNPSSATSTTTSTTTAAVMQQQQRQRQNELLRKLSTGSLANNTNNFGPIGFATASPTSYGPPTIGAMGGIEGMGGMGGIGSSNSPSVFGSGPNSSQILESPVAMWSAGTGRTFSLPLTHNPYGADGTSGSRSTSNTTFTFNLLQPDEDCLTSPVATFNLLQPDEDELSAITSPVATGTTSPTFRLTTPSVADRNISSSPLLLPAPRRNSSTLSTSSSSDAAAQAIQAILDAVVDGNKTSDVGSRRSSYCPAAATITANNNGSDVGSRRSSFCLASPMDTLLDAASPSLLPGAAGGGGPIRHSGISSSPRTVSSLQPLQPPQPNSASCRSDTLQLPPSSPFVALSPSYMSNSLTTPPFSPSAELLNMATQYSVLHCKICNMRFEHNLPTSFIQHMQTVHTKRQIHQCPVCSQSFRWESRLVAHMATHASAAASRGLELGLPSLAAATTSSSSSSSPSDPSVHTILGVDFPYDLLDSFPKVVSTVNPAAAATFVMEAAGAGAANALHQLLFSDFQNNTNPPTIKLEDASPPAPATYLKPAAALPVKKEPSASSTTKPATMTTTALTVPAPATDFRLNVPAPKTVAVPGAGAKGTFECKVSDCGRSFLSKLDLKGHMDAAHPDQKALPTFHCTFEGCNKSFFTESRLSAHKKFHANPNQFICHFPDCGKVFNFVKSLIVHARIHSGEKPYACSHPGCGKSFRQASGLRSHNFTHTGERPYVCTVCGKTYTTSSRLKIHIRSHTEEQPYVCDYGGCGKRFKQSSNLKQHRLVHMSKAARAATAAASTTNEIYCGFCGRYYKNETSFDQHLRREHPGRTASESQLALITAINDGGFDAMLEELVDDDERRGDDEDEDDDVGLDGGGGVAGMDDVKVEAVAAAGLGDGAHGFAFAQA